VGALQLLGDARLDQLVPAADEDLEPPLRLRGVGAPRGPHLGGEARQDLGVLPIGLGEGAEGAGEVADLAGIDADDRPAAAKVATTIRSEPPLASSTMRVGRRAWSCSGTRRRPPRERGTVQVAPVGSTAMSTWALATSIPIPTALKVAIA